jgi:GNAT superfamily N-acetyltransferase
VKDIVQFRLAEPNDADAIMGVINTAFREAEAFFIDGDRIDLNSVRAYLDAGKFLLAEDGAVLFGCVYVELRGERAYLGLLSVDPRQQKAGIGSQLMNAAEDYCAKAGCRVMDLQIVNLREELPCFYRRRGYVETGTAPFPADVKTKIRCHFVKMSKPLV